MDTSPSKHRRSIGKFLRRKWKKTFRRSPSPSASQQTARAPGAQSRSPSPSSTGRSSHTAQALVQTSLLPLSAGTSALGTSRNKPPTIVGSAAAAGPSNIDQTHINPATPIGSAAHTAQLATGAVWAGLQTALRAFHEKTGLFPPLQSAIGTLIDCLGVMEVAAKNRQGYEELVTDLTTLVKLMTQHMEQSSSVRMSDSVANIARSIEEQAKLIKSKQARGAASSAIEANDDQEDLEHHYRRIEALFRQLQADANLSMWNIVNDHMANTRLEGLIPVKLADYDSRLSEGISRRTCTANTRTAILSGLNDWSNNPEALDLYWMNGMAGTGKTTIACSFSDSLEERNQLGASFFCDRTVPECREATRIIPTIAYQLARYSVPFQCALCEMLGKDPDAGSRNMTKQFERLLKKPLLKVKEAIPSDLVVVIDALDECSDMREVELLLSILLKSISQLPLKFFVTSRPEPEIYKRMLARGQGVGDVLHLHDVEKSLVQADIQVYLTEELNFMSPTPEQIKELVERSGNLFIYAATLVRYIRPGKGSDPHERLHSALAITQPNRLHAEIDELYTAILGAAIGAEGLEDREVKAIKNVLWTAVCIQTPVDTNTIAAMTGLHASQVKTALDALRSVIHYSDSTGLVSILHSSFSEFMFDERRSNPFSCNLAAHSELLAQRCFEVMKSQLRFNICELDSSFVPDSKVENLEERVKQAISPPLWYACRYWGDHLRDSADSYLLCTMLNDFVAVRLLFWMEVLNLKREMHVGAGVMLQAKLWLQVSTSAAAADAVKLVEDSRNFVTSFAANSVSQSTPHIYISLLPFCSISSPVSKQYRRNMQGIINVTGSTMQRREAAPLASWGARSQAYSVGYSPDGNCIAVGCANGTVSVRSAHDGKPIAGPFQGHTSWVWSVRYSPDGKHIVSGSGDHTIRVWHAHNGELFAGPFHGHTDLVWSVGYSPDGSRIVSGSGDKTIRVWSAYNGEPLADPFHGHTNSVLAVGYSPDGTQIVSGSEDNTIRVWNAHDGTLHVSPFQGHTDSVWSVAYSPDGSRIVSGSEDNTIRVWSVDDGTLVAGPLQGHTDAVWSVGYSPDGSHIVSGSRDNTIRVWSKHDGALLASPFQGHTGSVWSVAFSPDGTRIVSSSSDSTIRVWGAQDSTPITGPSQGHTGAVLSVEYSPDGSRIVSSYSDHTIRVWGAHDGTLLTGPLQGHTNWVWSVGYSPDGSRIVSGSVDETIRVWSADDGALLAGPFRGHTDSVWSVAYSPDGSRIVSGSGDKTIRVWSAEDGTPIAGPFQGHTDSVFSVAYSPDGAQIVSGSADKTIRVWSAHDGEPLAGPFHGHAGVVFSVGYSHDGSRIISSSNDDTLRAWSTHDGALLAGPFRGHDSSVFSVKHSPDGTYVVSGSNDKTIRVWSAENCTPLASPFQGHTGSIWSVGYSPDGSHIVSGSNDSTIRVWSAPCVTSPSEAHTAPAMPAANPPFTMHVDSHSIHPTTTPSLCPPTQYHRDNRNSSNSFTDWTVRHDGWVVNKSSQLLFWVPFELAGYLPATHELLVIYPSDQFHINHGDMLPGELWHQCYRPE